MGIKFNEEDLEQRRHESYDAMIKALKPELDQACKRNYIKTGQHTMKPNIHHLTDAIERVVAFVVTDDNDLYMYDYDKQFYVDNDEIINRIARKVLYNGLSRQQLQTIKYALRSSEYAFRETELSEDEIPVRNGIVNRRTKELKAYDITLFVKNQLDVFYNPDVEYPSEIYDIDRFIFDTANNNETRYEGLMQVMNFAVTGINPHDNIVMFLGEGGSGKSAINKIISAMIGSHNMAALKLSQFNEDKYLVTLKNKITNIGDDLGDSQYIGELENLKTLSAHGKITVDVKHKPAIELKFPGLIIQNAARIPKFSESGEQLRRRLRVYKFENKFIGHKKKMSDKQFAEMINNEDVKSYLLNELIEIDIDQVLMGYDEALSDEVASINDDVGSFVHIMKNTKLMTLDQIPTSVLRAIYLDYHHLKLNDSRAISLGKFDSLMKPHMEKLNYVRSNNTARPKSCVDTVAIFDDIDASADRVREMIVDRELTVDRKRNGVYSFDSLDDTHPCYEQIMKENTPSTCWVKVE